MKIAAIRRATINSPGMAEKDLAILQATASELCKSGIETVILEEERFTTSDGYEAILHMSRSSDTLQRLREAEAKGCPVINSPNGVRNCSRIRFMQLIEEEGLPQPPYTLFDTTATAPQEGYPMWLKRADDWSCHRQDVCFAANAEEAEEALEAFRNRGIERVICCSHLEGDIVKFYGVEGKLFSWYYPDPEKSKFGLERINGKTSHHPFEISSLEDIAFTAAKAVGVEIFGGDCIVSADGTINIIDLNDFPSFAPCRDEASLAIAHFIHEKIKEKR